MLTGSVVTRDLLLLTARAHLDGPARESIRACLRDAPDLAAVVGAALEHGTAPLLCRHLLGSADDLLPLDLRHAANEYLESWRRTSDASVEDLLRILDALAAAGIPHIPFKGPALAQQAYGDLRLRAYRDLDILIRTGDIPPTMRILAELGYRSRTGSLTRRQREAYHRYNGQDILFAEGRMPVEPHWAFAPRTFNARLDMAGIWRRARPMPIAGRVTQVLSPEDLLTVTALHGAKEQWARLLWVADIAELLRSHPGLDWDMALRRAAEAGLRRILLLGAALAGQVLGAWVPGHVRRLAQADRTCQALAQEVTIRLFAVPRRPTSVFTLSGFQWRARERWPDRWRYAAASLTTARLQHLRMVDLPAPLGFTYPVVKIAHDYLALPLWLAGKSVVSRWPGRRPGSRADEA